MLNARLYRTCWLVAGVALVVALLTLQTPDTGPEPALPSAIDGQLVLDLDRQLAGIAPERAPGSGPDQAAARWVQDQLSQIPGGAGRVQVQELEARSDRETVQLRNVYVVVPGRGGGRFRSGIVVVAPRDTPAGVAAGTSSTAVLLRLAQVSATTRHQRPHLFVSTDGSTVGNAGMRWFLERFSAFPLSAAIVLDAPGEATGDRVHLWDAGRTDRQALGLARMAERSVERAGGRAELLSSITGQMLRLGVPQTFGDQGAAIAAGLPSVTLSARAESPLREGREPTAERMELVANAANDLLGVLDASTAVPAADGSLLIAGRTLRPTIARLALLLLALPVLVLALDIVARQRRARVPLGTGLRAVARRSLPLVAGLITAHLLVLAGMLPGTAAGSPPIPAQVPFDAMSGLAVVIIAAVVALTWWVVRTRARRRPAPPLAEGTAAIGALAVLILILWVLSPYALVLALPAAHAAILATGARRGWHLAALGLLVALPVLLLIGRMSGLLDSSPVFAVWYLLETAATGARGATGLVLGVLIVACIWSVGVLVAKRGIGAADRPRRRRRTGPGFTRPRLPRSVHPRTETGGEGRPPRPAGRGGPDGP
ncbi:MAG: hypothetical protein AB7O53_01800 [Thermoleophilia bacterium]